MFSLMPRRREGRPEGAMARREYTPFDLLGREFASLFNRAFAGWPVPFKASWEMMSEPWGLEMEEKAEEVVIRAEVPGFEASEIEVLVAGNLLTLRAEHKEAPEAKEKAEGKPVTRRYGRWERTMTLPEGVLPEKIEARYHTGVLEIHVPRTPQAVALRIEVKT